MEVGEGNSPQFQVKVVRHGCPLSPWLINTLMDGIETEVHGNHFSHNGEDEWDKTVAIDQGVKLDSYLTGISRVDKDIELRGR